MENLNELNLDSLKLDPSDKSNDLKSDNTVSETHTDKNIKSENPQEQSSEETANPPKTFDVSDYLMMMQIGSGNFSELYMVENKETKILYTMKTFTKARCEQLKKQEDVLMEKHVMNKLPRHDNIINYYGCARDEMFLYILYEYVNGGELWKKCVIYGLPSERLVKFYFLQILDGIKQMHKYNIIHRDIKVNLSLSKYSQRI
jgi:serine/threonine protein kinase